MPIDYTVDRTHGVRGDQMARLTLQGQRSGLRDLAYRSIRDAIVKMEIAPGERITEESLSDQLGVSRPVLRESLQRLQVEQLIDRLDNGRLRVRPATTEDVVHLYSVRSALEQLAVREAGVHMSAKHLADLSAAIEQMHDAETYDPRTVTEGGAQFHHKLAEIAGNPVNDLLMQQIRGPIDRFRHLSVTLSARPHHSVEEHEAILAALTENNIDAAATAMHQHIMSGRDAVLEAIKSLAAEGHPGVTDGLAVV
ncbi:GntR family transcriptional regulator [Rhodococcus opacus]|uniref:GntR family transcriptional regulator n=2 Tax=Rhodococcus opacus TaxID=37919 RepID=UPI001F583CF6|nr:GntR family transcriptional regulator [Rhodococcus opacus]UNN04672.1 GntR family transcriptional regulator [Rhodococcus opacus]